MKSINEKTRMLFGRGHIESVGQMLLQRSVGGQQGESSPAPLLCLKFSAESPAVTGRIPSIAPLSPRFPPAVLRTPRMTTSTRARVPLLTS